MRGPDLHYIVVLLLCGRLEELCFPCLLCVVEIGLGIRVFLAFLIVFVLSFPIAVCPASFTAIFVPIIVSALTGTASIRTVVDIVVSFIGYFVPVSTLVIVAASFSVVPSSLCAPTSVEAPVATCISTFTSDSISSCVLDHHLLDSIDGVWAHFVRDADVYPTYLIPAAFSSSPLTICWTVVRSVSFSAIISAPPDFCIFLRSMLFLVTDTNLPRVSFIFRAATHSSFWLLAVFLTIHLLSLPISCRWTSILIRPKFVPLFLR